jgi:hypothetical protein
MTATPAEVANDLAANAAFFQKRDEPTAQACRDCARMIRAVLAGETVDGHSYGLLHGRLLELCDRYRRSGAHIGVSLSRGMAVMTDLWREKGEPR